MELKQETINQTCGFKSRCIRLLSRRICRPAAVKYTTFQYQWITNSLKIQKIEMKNNQESSRRTQLQHELLCSGFWDSSMALKVYRKITPSAVLQYKVYFPRNLYEAILDKTFFWTCYRQVTLLAEQTFKYLILQIDSKSGQVIKDCSTL